jgi:hypothetical protein
MVEVVRDMMRIRKKRDFEATRKGRDIKKVRFKIKSGGK